MNVTPYLGLNGRRQPPATVLDFAATLTGVVTVTPYADRVGQTIDPLDGWRVTGDQGIFYFSPNGAAL